MSSENPVAIPSKKWVQQSGTWDMVDTLWAGTQAMRDAREEYLPQEPAEPEVAYQNRLKKSVLTPMFADSIKKLVGKILRKPVTVNDDVPSRIADMLDDVDAEGTELNEFVKELGHAALRHGVTFILVESPAFENELDEMGLPDLTIALERELGVRPYAIHVKAPQIIGWKTMTVGGEKMLRQVRVRMTVEEDSGDPQDEFSTVEVNRILVLDIGRSRTYEERKDDDGNVEWVLIRDVPVDLDFIPLIPIYSNRIEFMCGVTPLLDVAHLNVAHWQSDSDQRHILHVARVPLLFGSGLGDDERGDFQIQVGPNTMTRGPQGSDMKYVEHSGKGIDAGAKDLEVLEQRMSRLALNMILRRQPGDVTATSRALDQSEADSPLGMFARELENALATMLDIFSDYMGLGEDAGGTITLFKDFSLTARDGEDIKSLQAMRLANDISQRTYWQELVRRGLLSDDFDADEEIDLLDLEYQDSMQGLTEFEDQQANKPGDETGVQDGHTHVLQSNGYTNTVDGHRHRWEPTGSETSTDEGHSHTLRGVGDGETLSRQGQQEEGTAPAGPGQQDNQPPGG